MVERIDTTRDPFGETDLARLFGAMEVIIAPPGSVALNLAVDELLVEEAGATGRTVLRLWWGDAPTVVLGNSEKPEVVADLAACERLGVPVIKRRSGGGTVLQTADVLNYSLTTPLRPGLDVHRAFLVGGRLLSDALARLGLVAGQRGTSDVAIGERKISGNAQARRRGGLLLHGTLLYDLDLDLVDACLRHPPREPDYRAGRRHRDFLTSLRAEGIAVSRQQLQEALVAAALALGRGASAGD
ncbi:MAG: lipoate--protein ligase family protein [Chloroflexota bacterium]